MNLSKILKNAFLIILASLVLTACATKKTSTTGQMQGDVYTGSDSVEYLASGVPDRVFFAYDSYSLAASAQATLSKQAKWLKANPSIAIAIEGHADERGTREYNLALGDRRASSVKDYLMSQGISSNRISTISYGKERPVQSGSNDTSWAQNRRSVSVRTN